LYHPPPLSHFESLPPLRFQTQHTAQSVAVASESAGEFETLCIVTSSVIGMSSHSISDLQHLPPPPSSFELRHRRLHSQSLTFFWLCCHSPSSVAAVAHLLPSLPPLITLPLSLPSLTFFHHCHCSFFLSLLCSLLAVSFTAASTSASQRSLRSAMMMTSFLQQRLCSTMPMTPLPPRLCLCGRPTLQ
ncbi:hypothetical protein HN873_056354, partial [Arachis hypogaea]